MLKLKFEILFHKMIFFFLVSTAFLTSFTLASYKRRRWESFQTTKYQTAIQLSDLCARVVFCHSSAQATEIVLCEVEFEFLLQFISCFFFCEVKLAIESNYYGAEREKVSRLITINLILRWGGVETDFDLLYANSTPLLCWKFAISSRFNEFFLRLSFVSLSLFIIIMMWLIDWSLFQVETFISWIF